MILSIVTLLIFAISLTVFEGMYFHQQRGSKRVIEWVHELLMVIRLTVLLLFYQATGAWLLCIAAFGLFPLIHDGIYYETRNYFSPGLFPKGWKDHSKEDTSLMSIDFLDRLCYACLGVIFIFAHVWSS